jgi:hypothetical protein
MNFLSIIQTLESLLLEFILLLIFLPKTLLRVVLHPSWVSDYLQQELAREEDDRFNDYSSPMAMFLFLGAIPIFVFFSSTSGETISIPFVQGSKTYELTMLQYFIFTSLLMLVGPLYMSLANLFFKKLPFNKKNLRRIILSQAYIWTVPYFAYMCGSIFRIISCGDAVLCFGIEETLSVFLIGLIWLIAAEIILFSKELGKTKAQSSLIVIPILFLYFVLFFLTGNFIEASLR